MAGESTDKIQKNLSFWSDLCGFLVLLGLVAYGLYRIKLGLDFTDEGLYVSSPLRYALGDQPFLDETSNSLRMFDLLLWPIFSFNPQISLFQLRLIGLGLHLAGLTAVILLLRPFAPAFLVALAGGTAIFSYEWVWAPGYNLMGPVFLTGGLCTWLGACRVLNRTLAPALSVLAGLALFAGVFSYLPFLPVLVAPLAVLGIEVWKKRWGGPYFKRTSLVFLGFFVGLLTTILGFYANGWVEDWWKALHVVISSQGAVRPFSERLIDYWLNLRVSLLYALIVAAVLSAGCRLLPKKKVRRGWVLTGALSLILGGASSLLIFYYPAATVRWEQYPASFAVFSAGLGFHLAALVSWLLHWGDHRGGVNNQPWNFIWMVIFPAGAFLCFLHAMSSTNGFINMFYSMTLLAASGPAALYQASLFGRRNGEKISIPAGGLAVCLGAALVPYAVYALTSGGQLIYRDQTPAHLTARFSQPKIDRIFSTPQRVKVVDTLLKFIEKRVEKGDLLLAYDSLPLLYFLTDARPPLNHVWTNKSWDPGLRAEALKSMIERQRIPRYCVQTLVHPEMIGRSAFDNTFYYSTDPKVDPIHAFVRSNYRPIALFYPFQIWEHNGYARDGRMGDPLWVAKVEPWQWLGKSGHGEVQGLSINGDTTRFVLTPESDADGPHLALKLTDHARKEFKEAQGDKPVFTLWLTRTLDPNIVAGRPMLTEVPVRLIGSGTCRLFLEDFVGQARIRHEIKPAASDGWTKISLDSAVRPEATAVQVSLEFRPAAAEAELHLRDLKIRVD